MVGVLLSKSDTPIEQYFPVFANTGVNVVFLVPTETGYAKSMALYRNMRGKR